MQTKNRINKFLAKIKNKECVSNPYFMEGRGYISLTEIIKSYDEPHEGDTQHQHQIEVSSQMLEESSYVTEDIIIRDLCHAFIKNLPIEDIKEIFNVKKIDPNSPESQAKLRNPLTSGFDRSLIINMLDKRTFKYNAKLLQKQK